MLFSSWGLHWSILGTFHTPGTASSVFLNSCLPSYHFLRENNSNSRPGVCIPSVLTIFSFSPFEFPWNTQNDFSNTPPTLSFPTRTLSIVRMPDLLSLSQEAWATYLVAFWMLTSSSIFSFSLPKLRVILFQLACRGLFLLRWYCVRIHHGLQLGKIFYLFLRQ